MMNAPVIYYRLVSVDKDGKKSFSQAVAVEFTKTGKNEKIAVFPNPFNTEFTVEVTADMNTEAVVEITDLQGKVAATYKQQVAAGKNTIIINDLQGLKAGMYFVKTVVGAELNVLKLLKD
jgi:hypothetical protein